MPRPKKPATVAQRVTHLERDLARVIDAILTLRRSVAVVDNLPPLLIGRQCYTVAKPRIGPLGPGLSGRKCHTVAMPRMAGTRC